MPHARHNGAVVDIRIGSALHNQETCQSSLHAGQRVIHDRIISGYMKLELRNQSATGRYRDGLNTFQRWVRQTSEIVDLVEDLLCVPKTLSGFIE
jgi:hypothetical protein